eukprot:354880-Chlamydomonas_euryale.AAC.5
MHAAGRPAPAPARTLPAAAAAAAVTAVRRGAVLTRAAENEVMRRERWEWNRGPTGARRWVVESRAEARRGETVGKGRMGGGGLEGGGLAEGSRSMSHRRCFHAGVLGVQRHVRDTSRAVRRKEDTSLARLLAARLPGCPVGLLPGRTWAKPSEPPPFQGHGHAHGMEMRHGHAHGMEMRVAWGGPGEHVGGQQRAWRRAGRAYARMWMHTALGRVDGAGRGCAWLRVGQTWKRTSIGANACAGCQS